MSKIKMPKALTVQGALACVVNKDCLCVSLHDPSRLREQLIHLSEFSFEPEELLLEFQAIVLNTESTREACLTYVVLIEFLRKVFIPSATDPKASKKTKKIELFISHLDEKITFKE